MKWPTSVPLINASKISGRLNNGLGVATIMAILQNKKRLYLII